MHGDYKVIYVQTNVLKWLEWSTISFIGGVKILNTFSEINDLLETILAAKGHKKSVQYS